MIENSIPYWTGKKRDNNTLKKLSESKYKKIAQYDGHGNLIKIWDSAKDIAINIFNDYKIVNGGGDTKFYGYLSSPNLKTRFKEGYYWIRLEEFKNNIALEKINVEYILDQQKKEHSKRVSISRKKSKKVKTCQNKPVYEIDSTSKRVIGVYASSKIAGQKLNIQESSINRCCRNDKEYASGRVFIFKNLKDREKYNYRLEKRNKEKAEIERIKQDKINSYNERKELRKKISKITLNVDTKYVPKLKRPLGVIKDGNVKMFNTITLAANFLDTKGFYILNAMNNNEKIKGYSFKYLDIN